MVDEHSVLRLQEIRREGAHPDELPVGADEHEECEEGEDVGLQTRQHQPLLRYSGGHFARRCDFQTPVTSSALSHRRRLGQEHARNTGRIRHSDSPKKPRRDSNTPDP